VVPLLRASIGGSCRKNACQKETVKKPCKKTKRNRARKLKETRKEIVRETRQDTVKQTRKKHGKKPEGNFAKNFEHALNGT